MARMTHHVPVTIALQLRSSGRSWREVRDEIETITGQRFAHDSIQRRCRNATDTQETPEGLILSLGVVEILESSEIGLSRRMRRRDGVSGHNRRDVADGQRDDPLMLTSRANRAGTLWALYRGESRVGYVFQRDPRRDRAESYAWELRLLRPQGGHYQGCADTIDAALLGAESHFSEWLVAAQLRTESES